MDLSRLDSREKAHEGVEVALEFKGEKVISEDDGKPIVFTLRGATDPDIQTLLLKNKGDKRTAEEVLESDLKLARATVVSWSDNVRVGEEIVPFARANIERVFSIPYIRQNVLLKIYDEARFMKGL